MLLPAFGFGQQAVLLDRNLISPALVTDSVTFDQVSKGLMPFFIKDVDSLLLIINQLKKYINTGKRQEPGVKAVVIGNSRCIARTERKGANDKYYVSVATDIGKVKTSMVVVAGEFNKTAIRRLSIFEDYLKNNMAALE